MAGIINFSDLFGILRQKIVGDTTDRLVNLCSLLSLICCMINIGQQIIGKPMTCTSKYDKEYVNLLCYTKPFYHVPLEDHAIRLGGREEYNKINYFQFLALAFFTQAAILYIPSYLWKKTYKKADIKLGNIVKTAIEIRDGADDRSLKISTMGATIIKKYKTYTKVGCNSYWKMIKNALILRYLAMKIANVFLLAYFINNVSSYLSNDHFWWSGEHLIDYLKGEKWIDSEQFPRLAYCDFAMRDMANVKSITAQCVLAMNFISEKLFFVEWIWFTFVFVLLLLNIAAFSFSLIRRTAKISEWLYRHIKAENITQSNKFREFIGWDGYLTIYLVECAAGVDIASDFTADLYEQFITDYNPMAPEASYSTQLSITLSLS